MTGHQGESAWSRVRFVLADPSAPANIGAAARAVKTMGFSGLWVSNPRVRDYREDPDALRMATQAADVLRGSRMTDTLLEALDGVRFAWALSGYDREFGPPIRELPRATDAACELLQATPEGDVAFVFGTERDGLSNSEVLLCQGIAAIPASAEMPSLNLAQAVQVCAYEMRRSLRSREGGEGLLGWETPFERQIPAGPVAMEGFMEHLQEALASVGMTRRGDSRKIMQRLRTLFARAQPTEDEIVLLRAVCAAVLRPRRRAEAFWQEAQRREKPDGWTAGKDKRRDPLK